MGEVQGERRALGGLRIQGRTTSMEFGDALDDGEAEAGARDAASTHIRAAVETLEDLVAPLRRDAGPVVLDLDADPGAVVLEADADGTAHDAVRGCVVEQVRDGACQQGGIPDDRRGALAGHGHGYRAVRVRFL